MNPPHPPHENAIEAFISVEHTIKTEILKSRHHWEKHEPRMWSRAEGIPDHELVTFTIHKDLVEIRSGVTSYGTIILGKIRLPAVNDAEGEGYIHVRYAVTRSFFADCPETPHRIHDPPNRVRIVFPYVSSIIEHICTGRRGCSLPFSLDGRRKPRRRWTPDHLARYPEPRHPSGVLQ